MTGLLRLGGYKTGICQFEEPLLASICECIPDSPIIAQMSAEGRYPKTNGSVRMSIKYVDFWLQMGKSSFTCAYSSSRIIDSDDCTRTPTRLRYSGCIVQGECDEFTACPLVFGSPPGGEVEFGAPSAKLLRQLLQQKPLC